MKSLPIERITELCQKYGIDRLGLFGSVARGDDTPSSDIDFLVALSNEPHPLGHAFFRLVQLQLSLEALLHTKVDLLTEYQLKNPFLAAEVMEELIPIYDKQSSEIPV